MISPSELLSEDFPTSILSENYGYFYHLTELTSSDSKSAAYHSLSENLGVCISLSNAVPYAIYPNSDKHDVIFG